jgi:hypothetical protein
LSVRHHGFSHSSLYKVTSEQAPRNLLIKSLVVKQNPQSARRNNFPGEQISRWFLLLSEHIPPQIIQMLLAAYPRIDLASLIQTDPQRFWITGRLPLVYHR